VLEGLHAEAQRPLGLLHPMLEVVDAQELALR
jgi:hypothetical protein